MNPALSARSREPAPLPKLSDTVESMVRAAAERAIREMMAERRAEFSKGLYEDAIARVQSGMDGFGLQLFGGSALQRPMSAADINFSAAGATVLPSTAQVELRRVVWADQYILPSDATDLAGIQRAFNASAQVAFANRTYNLGNLAQGAVAVTINGGGGKVALLTPMGQTQFTCNTTSSGNPSTCFLIQNAVGVNIDNLAFTDTGYVQTTTYQGAIGLEISAAFADVTDVNIRDLRAFKMVAPIILDPFATTRVRGVKINNIYADTCTYGFAAENNGDGVAIDNLYCIRNLRTYFAYGCTGHRVKVYDTQNVLGSNGSVVVAAYSTGNATTTDLDIAYHCDNPNMAVQFVHFTTFGEASRTVQNVRLTLDIDSGTVAIPVQFTAYNADGSVENTGTTNNVWDVISVRGRLNAPSAANTMAIGCQPSTKGHLIADPSIDQTKFAASIGTYFNIN